MNQTAITAVAICLIPVAGFSCLWLGLRMGLNQNVDEEIKRRQRKVEIQRRKYEGGSSPSTRAAAIRPTASLRSQAEVDEDSR